MAKKKVDPLSTEFLVEFFGKWKGQDAPKRILGDLRIGQSVINDLLESGHIKYVEGENMIEYVVDPYQYEDVHFPTTVKLIQEAREARSKRIIEEISKIDLLKVEPMPEGIKMYPEMGEMPLGKILREPTMKLIEKIINETE